MSAVDEIKAFASLTSGLLARKGAARPAMRPQYAAPAQQENGLSPLDSASAVEEFDPMAAAQADLGWNDHGLDIEDEAVAPQAAVPEVLRQREELEDSFAAHEAFEDADGVDPRTEHTSHVALTPMGLPGQSPVRRPHGDFAGGRRAAFTLRVDHDRHLRLRLACTLQNRSAQQVVTEALDRLLDEMPGLEELTRRVRRH